jgi:hypothetical protein
MNNCKNSVLKISPKSRGCVLMASSFGALIAIGWEEV